jgi:hypothetical protein
VGVKWCYDITNDIIDILAGKEVKAAIKSIAKAVGLAIGQAGIDNALVRLSELKKNDEYQISAMDYFYLANELDKKHNLKQESIKIFNEGLMDFPDDFQLNYYFAEALVGINDKKTLDLYQNCIRLYTGNEKNKRYSEEYKKALDFLNGNADKKDVRNGDSA